VILDILAEARAVDELDRIDAETPQQLGETLQVSEVRVHHEAKGMARAPRWFRSALRECVAHDRLAQPITEIRPMRANVVTAGAEDRDCRPPLLMYLSPRSIPELR
jgi:hypothetical protein